MCELFFKLWKQGEGKKQTKMNLLFIFLCLLKEGPLFMRVPSWWSVGCGGVTDALAGGGAHISLQMTSRGKGLFQNVHLQGQGWQRWEE